MSWTNKSIGYCCLITLEKYPVLWQTKCENHCNIFFFSFSSDGRYNHMTGFHSDLSLTEGFFVGIGCLVKFDRNKQKYSWLLVACKSQLHLSTLVEISYLVACYITSTSDELLPTRFAWVAGQVSSQALILYLQKKIVKKKKNVVSNLPLTILWCWGVGVALLLSLVYRFIKYSKGEFCLYWSGSQNFVNNINKS